jgi:hypothetical protein
VGSTATITGASPNLVSLSTAIAEPAHPYLRVVLRATGPSATGNVYAELSADLVVKGGWACGGASGNMGAAGASVGAGVAAPTATRDVGLCCSGQNENGSFTGCTAKAGIGANHLFNTCALEYAAICEQAGCAGVQGNKTCKC